MKLPLLAGALCFCVSVTHAQQCPPPQSFLGHTMQEARTLMDKNFPGKWSNNGPLCSGNYFNLMTEVAGENAVPICGTPQFPVQRLILAGFDDASQVMGALYDLSGAVDLDALPAQIALALKVELKPAQRSPSGLLNRSLGKTITTARNFLSTDGRYFVIVGQSLAPGNVMVHVYDLLAVAADQAPLETCTKEFGR
ncbi:hypothetical protein G5S34_13160 [Herbaspirillum frisingense]|uniref:hypothetical protein n=1 Tax=Herbaspirillum frisingense TaxID=92645 RepID=UPI0016047E3E|nr:hypothetical protein [Herbaspirillum frisingense]QNB07620.1 hypothetical protein G5S34_13160 [Herbaspirillum frisingense]